MQAPYPGTQASYLATVVTAALSAFKILYWPAAPDLNVEYTKR